MSGEWFPTVEFWTTLLEVTSIPDPQAYRALYYNCTHVTGTFWIMEGDTDHLRDAGIKFVEVAEGAVGSLGDLTEAQLKDVCLQSYGVRL